MGIEEGKPVDIKSAQYQIFKKKSALRFQLSKPTEHFKVGCLFMQIAPCKGNSGLTDGYAWEDHKISVKLGINDLSSIRHGLMTNHDVSLFHKFREDSKQINLNVNPERGGFFLSVTQNDTKVSIPISAAESNDISTLFGFSLPVILGWL